jgi:hypothetical protein
MADRDAMAHAHDIFDPLVRDHLDRPGVDLGPMFGTVGLRIRGRVYAFVGHEGDLVVKVPAEHADALVAAGAARRMVMRERELREWVMLPAASGAESWATRMDEAHRFVDSLTPR